MTKPKPPYPEVPYPNWMRNPREWVNGEEDEI
jgi:hypothetical protein